MNYKPSLRLLTIGFIDSRPKIISQVKCRLQLGADGLQAHDYVVTMMFYTLYLIYAVS